MECAASGEGGGGGQLCFDLFLIKSCIRNHSILSGVMEKKSSAYCSALVSRPCIYIIIFHKGADCTMMHDDKWPISVTPHISLLAISSAPASLPDDERDQNRVWAWRVPRTTNLKRITQWRKWHRSTIEKFIIQASCWYGTSSSIPWTLDSL